MAKVKQGKELSIKLGATRGGGAALFSKFKEAKVNVIASACYQIDDQAHFTIVADDPERAYALLSESGHQVRSEPVLLFQMPNQPGALADVLQEIAAIGVSVTSAYATTSVKEVALVVLKTEDDEKVVAELNRSGD